MVRKSRSRDRRWTFPELRTGIQLISACGVSFPDAILSPCISVYECVRSYAKIQASNFKFWTHTLWIGVDLRKFYFLTNNFLNHNNYHRFYDCLEFFRNWFQLKEKKNKAKDSLVDFNFLESSFVCSWNYFWQLELKIDCWWWFFFQFICYYSVSIF